MVEYKERGWLSRWAEKEAGKDRLRMSERIGQVVGIIVTLLVAGYFIILLDPIYGFYTDQFSTVDEALFFIGIFWGLVPLAAKMVLGRKNVTRPLESIGSVLFLIVAFLFLADFPFDFSHFADALPQSLQFLLSWITNGLVEALLVLGVIFTLILLPYGIILYLAVRRELIGRKT